LFRFNIKPGKPPIPEGAAAWVECKVESSQELDGCYLVIARVVDQKDLGNPPLIWQKDALFALKPL
jgi:flavin reductase (DIM6/NTAB) family NADH-FMN oxidoreductase RutF